MCSGQPGSASGPVTEPVLSQGNGEKITGGSGC